MNPRLEIEVGKQVGAEFEIPLKSEEGDIFLGRDPFCKVRLFDLQLSRRHCRLSYDGQRVLIKDLDSKNGTKVNGRRIRKVTELSHGDHIGVGSSRLVLKHPGAVTERKGLSPVWRHKSEAELLAEQAGNLVGQQFADLQVEEKLWDGELATIYRVRKAQEETPLALKILRPDAGPSIEQQNRFLRGARLASRLNYPALVKMLQFGQHMEISYSVMEFVHGTNLERLVEEAGRPMRLEAALAVTRQMLDALQHVYEQRCVMRLVRPDNVLVLKGSRIKLADFDLLKQLPDEAAREVTRVIERGIFADPPFAAPELISNPLVADQRTDVFGAAACLHFMLTRAAPFPKTLPGDDPVKAFDRPPPDTGRLNPKVPEAIGDVIRKGLAPMADERYATARDMLAAIDDEAHEALQ